MAQTQSESRLASLAKKAILQICEYKTENPASNRYKSLLNLLKLPYLPYVNNNEIFL